MKFIFPKSVYDAVPSRDLLSAMELAAMGKPMPGRIGLVQSLCNVWTTATPDTSAGRIHKALWVARSSFASFGVWRAYQESMTSTTTQKDSISEFCKSEKISSDPSLRQSAYLILAASLATVPYDTLSLKDKKDLFVLKFKPVGSKPYYFVTIKNDMSEFVPIRGPLFVHEPDTKVDCTEVLQEVLWKQFRSNVVRLSLSNNPADLLSHPVLDLSDIGPTDPFISDETSENWTNALAYAKRCHAFTSNNLIRAILLYGPPGTGKSSLAINILGGMGRVLKISASTIHMSDFTPVSNIIKLLNPKIIVFDDIDRFTNSDMSCMLEYMEGLRRSPPIGGRIIVGTVNTIKTLDPALLRAGRFDEVLFVPEPGDTQRLAIVRHYIQFFGGCAKHLDAETLSNKMQGFSPADVRSIIETVSCVGTEHVEVEIDRVRAQRKLFEGDSVQNFLSRTTPS